MKEMSKRMLKRSLSGLKEGSAEQKENATTSGPLKKPKHIRSSRIPLAEVQRRSLTQNPNVLKTPPSRRDPSQDTIKDNALKKTPGLLSPPLAMGLKTVFQADSQMNMHSSSSFLSSPFAKQRNFSDNQPTSARLPSLRPHPQIGRARSSVYAFRRNSTRQTRPSKAALTRHTSAAQPVKKTAQQDWLVPPPQDNPILHGNLRDIRTLEASLSREGSFFAQSPQAFSTPAHNHGRLSRSAHTPSTSGLQHLQKAAHGINKQLSSDDVVDNVTMRESTPRARMMLDDYIAYPEDTVPSDTLEPAKSADEGHGSPLQAVRQRTHFHFSEDSIFSSALDFSQTMTMKQPLRIPAASAVKESVDPSKLNEFLLTTRAPASKAVPLQDTSVAGPEPSPAQSDREELRDLFAVFGIEG
jgi:hypothetical protein